MLSLRFSRDDYAFVYTEGRPIGVILVGETEGLGQFSLLFSGRVGPFQDLAAPRGRTPLWPARIGQTAFAVPPFQPANGCSSLVNQ